MDKTKFINAKLNKIFKIFVIYIVVLKVLKITRDVFGTVQVAYLQTSKRFIKFFFQYLNYAIIF